MKRDYLITFLVEFLTLACGVLVFKLAAVCFGKDGFSEYAVARRMISFLQLPLLLGLGLSIPRTIAFCAGQSARAEKASACLLAGLLMEGCLFAVLFLLFLLIPGQMAFLFFGDQAYRKLVFPIGIAMAAGALHALVYGYFRGQLQMVAANLLQLTNIGIVPLAVFAIPNVTVATLLTIMGIVSIIITLSVIGQIWYRHPPGRAEKLAPLTAELLKYGGPRVPGELALTGLMALPVFFTAHFHNVTLAGQLAFAISLLSMVGSLFAPLGLILLPTLSEKAAQHTLITFKPTLTKMLFTSGGLCLAITGLAEWLAAPFIHGFLGPEFQEAIHLVRIILLGALPYVVYIILRNVLDAIDVRPWNTVNLLIALGLFCLLFFVMPQYPAAPGLVAALVVLGLSSFWQGKRLLRKFAFSGDQTDAAIYS